VLFTLAIGIRCSGHEEILGTVDRADPGRQVLATGSDGTAQPRAPGHPDRGGPWSEGFSRPVHLGIFSDRVQTCIVHLISFSMHFATWRERRPIRAALRPTTKPNQASLHKRGCGSSTAVLGGKYPAIGQSWRSNWEQVIPLFAFAPKSERSCTPPMQSRVQTRKCAKQ